MCDPFDINGFPTLDQLCGPVSPSDHTGESDCRCSSCSEERVCAAEAKADAIKENRI